MKALYSGSVIIGIEGLRLTQNDIFRLNSACTMGVILFSRNYHSLKQLTELCQSIKAVRPDLQVTVDQEGGRVQRFKKGFTRLSALGYFGQVYLQSPKRALVEAKNAGKIMSEELKTVGVDLSFAPVVDLGINTEIIGDRAFSHDPDIIIELARAYIEGMAENDMFSVLKHYPGHGSVSGDTHTHCIIDKRSFEEIQKTDLKPFMHLADIAHGVMVSHVVYPDICEHQASFSSIWIQQILREQIGFKGKVYTDDMGMQGAKTFGDINQSVCSALDAGCDVVLLCNEFSDIDKIVRK